MISLPKEIPVLFQPDMVYANFQRTKTMTRRTSGLDIINGFPGPGPHPSRFKFLRIEERYHSPSKRNELFAIMTFTEDNAEDHAFAIRCPFGIEKDVLYARERFRLASWNFDDGEALIEYLDGQKDWKQTPDWDMKGRDWLLEQWEKLLDGNYIYPECNPSEKNPDPKMVFAKDKTVPWTPGIHMPKEISRQHLLRNGILKLERLQDISEDDAEAEGAPLAHFEGDGIYTKDNYNTLDLAIYSPRYKTGFRSIIQRIHGEHIWEKNPWVWAVGYSLIDNFDKYHKEHIAVKPLKKK